MNRIPENYIEKLYAGWYGKVIGVRYGAPIENWLYEKIEKTYGELDGYIVDYDDFAADDDTNGPLFFLKALEDYTYTRDITAEEMGLTWLNYAPYQHGFYWWGGYGISTEHTAYLNLYNGVKAPRSGSIEQNGKEIAEQIGGQIFIDTWGLVIPGNPALAAEYAGKAASVSHDGNGMYGGQFIAACISSAFVEDDMTEIINQGLSVIPEDCDYARVTKAVMDFHKENPDDWRACYQFIRQNFGYDKFTGMCHIIPNSGVMVLSLLYGEGEFDKTINICNMCGWDTDCTVGNIGTIIGVKCGIEEIDYKKWRQPIKDLLICSSVIGSLNILDMPWAVSYIADLAYKIAGEKVPKEWEPVVTGSGPKFHFNYPDSTHAFRVSSDVPFAELEYLLSNTTDTCHSGNGCLKAVVKSRELRATREVNIFHKTHYRPTDFHDSRYDPAFSPILYPGQSIETWYMAPEDSIPMIVYLYVKDDNSGKEYLSEKQEVVNGQWQHISFDIPRLEGAVISEAGLKVIPMEGRKLDFVIYIDDFDFSGQVDYTIDFEKERTEVWGKLHHEISQYTYWKGIWRLEDGQLSGSCTDRGETYTGHHDWTDYSYSAILTPKLGDEHFINFRVQGAVRSYAIGFTKDQRLVLLKNNNGYTELTGIEYKWNHDENYEVKIVTIGNKMCAYVNNDKLLEFTDTDHPYLKGQIGCMVMNSSHCHYRDIKVVGIK